MGKDKRASGHHLRRSRQLYEHVMLLGANMLVAAYQLDQVWGSSSPANSMAQGLVLLLGALSIARIAIFKAEGQTLLSTKFIRPYHLVLASANLLLFLGDPFPPILLNEPLAEPLAIAFIGMVLGLMCSSLLSTTPSAHRLHTGLLTAGLTSRAPRASEQDIHIACVHESGHALLYACLHKTPRDLHLNVLDEPQDGRLGYVQGLQHNHLVLDEPTAEWQMLLLLGGQAAEEAVLKRGTMGAIGDNTAWLKIATAYLSNMHRGTFYPEPANDSEMARNAAELLLLFKEQKESLISFMQDNMTALLEIAQLAKEHRLLTATDLSPILACVKVPPHFPRPTLAADDLDLNLDEPGMSAEARTIAQ